MALWDDSRVPGTPACFVRVHRRRYSKPKLMVKGNLVIVSNSLWINFHISMSSLSCANSKSWGAPINGRSPCEVNLPSGFFSTHLRNSSAPEGLLRFHRLTRSPCSAPRYIVGRIPAMPPLCGTAPGGRSKSAVFLQRSGFVGRNCTPYLGPRSQAGSRR